MQKAIRRNAFRTLLLFHFLGIALSVGSRFVDFVIEKQTEDSSLQMLTFGRDLTGVTARTLTAPGFWLVIVTGVAMTLLRYGRRPPIWVWIKIGLTVVGLVVASALVAPALQASRQWAHWSVDHNQLAQQFVQSASHASFYGAIVFTLFLINLPVAIWKPFLSVKPPFSGSKKSEAQAIVEQAGGTASNSIPSVKQVNLGK
ncbi:hypothetical protein [Paraburkholderia flava]|uniref:hypothetical protein n=1 Tax=Paraburkholderia flava TaxID=2547393 RepID=UPI00105D649F|nr:hypothetical protein [Paraburkholderia flava]